MKSQATTTVRANPVKAGDAKSGVFSISYGDYIRSKQTVLTSMLYNDRPAAKVKLIWQRR